MKPVYIGTPFPAEVTVHYLNHSRKEQSRILRVFHSIDGYYALDVSGHGDYPNNNLGCGKTGQSPESAIRLLVEDHGSLLSIDDQF